MRERENVCLRVMFACAHVRVGGCLCSFACARDVCACVYVRERESSEYLNVVFASHVCACVCVCVRARACVAEVVVVVCVCVCVCVRGWGWGGGGEAGVRARERANSSIHCGDLLCETTSYQVNRRAPLFFWVAQFTWVGTESKCY